MNGIKPLNFKYAHQQNYLFLLVITITYFICELENYPKDQRITRELPITYIVLNRILFL